MDDEKKIQQEKETIIMLGLENRNEQKAVTKMVI